MTFCLAFFVIYVRELELATKFGPVRAAELELAMGFGPVRAEGELELVASFRRLSWLLLWSRSVGAHSGDELAQGRKRGGKEGGVSEWASEWVSECVRACVSDWRKRVAPLIKCRCGENTKNETRKQKPSGNQTFTNDFPTTTLHLKKIFSCHVWLSEGKLGVEHVPFIATFIQ